jgi:hypothetical protein
MLPLRTRKEGELGDHRRSSQLQILSSVLEQVDENSKTGKRE